jgi:hypothetical protein
MEEYKIIEGFENYSVSNYGNVKNNKTGKNFKLCLDTNGYYKVDLYKNGDYRRIVVHRLVAMAFIPNPENKPQVDHIDNIRTNNNVNNLRWVSNSENNQNKGIYMNNTSGVKGVNFNKRKNKWRAYIHHNGKNYHLGYFENLEDAAKARQTKAKELFGEFINKIELEININNIKPNTKLKLNININNDEQKEIEELEREFEELIK